MLGAVARTSLLGRNVMKNFVRNGSHGGVPGENLPFNVNSRTAVTLHFFWFITTSVGAPFLITLYQLAKK